MDQPVAIRLSSSLPRQIDSVTMSTALVALILSLLAGRVHAGAAELSGRWALEFQRKGSEAVFVADCVWEQEGTRLSGACASGFESLATVTGEVADPGVKLQLTYGADNATVMTFEGRLRDAEVRGTWRSLDAKGNAAAGTFTAMRR